MIDNMTKNIENSMKLKQIPVISMQCDWDEAIFSPNQEIWVSSKFRGKSGVYSKLRSCAGTLPKCITNDFSVLSLGRTFVEIQFNPIQHSCIFVAPNKLFSKIHTKKIVSLNVTEELAVSVCTDDKLLVWNVITQKVVTTLKGHLGSVYKCKFFPSKLVVLSAGADMTLKIWSAKTGECPVTLVGHKEAVNDFCIVDKGRNVISVSKDGTAKLWDCGKSNCLATIFQIHQILNCCTIARLPDGVYLDREEEVTDREVGTKNKMVLIGSEEGFVHGIGVFSRKKIFLIDAGSAINVLLTVSDKIVIGCQNGSIKIYKTSCTKTPLEIFDESSSPILSGCVYKEKGVFMGRSDGSVTYYDCLNFSNIRISLTGPFVDPVTDMTLLDNGKMYTCCRDGIIREYFVNEIIDSIYFSSCKMN